MRLPILYSLTSHGQTQTWQIEVKDECFRTHEGIKDGVITTSAWTECEGKNIGRANETAPFEQADKEAVAKHKKKLELGYQEKEEDIHKTKFFEPMTAKKWKDRWKKVVFPVYSQPKLDGMRCLVAHDGLWSRYGKPIKSAPHIFETMKPFIAKNLVWDGELYAHKFKRNFDKIISLAKKTKPTPEDLADSAKHLQYWVYDYCLLNKPYKVPFSERTEFIKRNKKKFGSSVIVVETTLCNNIEELDACYHRYLNDGMEGEMVRIPDSPYENKRSNNLLKRKEFIDGEFELVDLEEGKGNLKGIAARAFLVTKNGLRFDAGMIGSHEYCQELLENKKKVIGKMATVVYQNLTPDGKPRFAKLKIIRDYE